VGSGRRVIRGESTLRISGKNRRGSRGVHFHCQTVTDSGRLQITVLIFGCLEDWRSWRGQLVRRDAIDSWMPARQACGLRVLRACGVEMPAVGRKIKKTGFIYMWVLTRV